MKLSKTLLVLLGIVTSNFLILGQANAGVTKPNVKIIKVQLFDNNPEYDSKCKNGREFAIIKNLSEQEIDLDGWVIRWDDGDGSTKNYSISGLTIISPASEVIFYNKYFLSDNNCQFKALLAKETDFVNQFGDLKFEIATVQAGRFDAKNGYLKIFDKQNQLVDQLNYGDSGLELEETADTIATWVTNDDFKYDDQGNLLYISFNRANKSFEYVDNPVYQEPKTCDDGYFYDEKVDKCRLLKPDLIFSEVLSSASPKSDQYIEIFNQSQETVDLTGFKIVDNFNNQFVIESAEVKSGDYLAFFSDKTELNYDDQSFIELKLISLDNQTVIAKVKLPAISSEKVHTFDGEKWDWSFVKTPSLKNIISQQLECKTGYHWNQDFGKCLVNTNTYIEEKQAGKGSGDNNKELATTVNKKAFNLIQKPSQKTCQEGYEIGYTGSCVKKCGIGQYRSKETNRCKNNISLNIKKTVKTCSEGYELNPITNRCRKKQVNPCQEGYEIGYTGSCVKKCNADYERSKETNRCRKIPESAELTPEQKQTIEGAFEQIDEQPKLNFWKLFNNPIAGAIIGAGIVFGIQKFGKN